MALGRLENWRGAIEEGEGGRVSPRERAQGEGAKRGGGGVQSFPVRCGILTERSFKMRGGSGSC